MKYRVLLILLLLATYGCATSTHYGETKTVIMRQSINELQKETVPGTVNDVWVEEMYDTVRVPAQLDPEGIYYRPSHETVVEIRPGKFQKGQYPDFDGNYPSPGR